MPTTTERPRNRDGLQVTAYEQASGLLLASLVLFGLVAVVLAAAWYSTRLWVPKTLAVKIVTEPQPKPKDVGEGGKGDGLGDQPVAEEFVEPAAVAPALEPTTEILEAISLAASQSETAVDDLKLVEHSSRTGTGTGDKNGDGNGDRDGPGTESGVPAYERWEVRFNPTTVEEYSRQLDQFQIELGVAGGGSPEVIYLRQFLAAKPSVRTGKPQDEQRLRFMHRSGVLRDADKKLAAKAGVDTTGKIVFQFYPQAMYDKLLPLEAGALGSHTISDVRRTIFGVKEAGGQYEFYVISQEYR